MTPYTLKTDVRNVFDVALRYEALGEYDMAMRYLSQVVEHFPNWTEARYHLGMAYARTKQREKA